MRKLEVLLLSALAAVVISCGTSGGGASTQPSVSDRASLDIVVDPNPIVAREIPGGQYEFPFTISLRETAGVAVTVDQVRLDVYALGGALRLYEVAYNRDQIAQMGYPTTIPPRGEITYRLNPKKEVPDDRLFGGVEGELRIDATDANGNRVWAEETVTVRR